MSKIRMAETPAPPRKPQRRPLLRYAVLLAMLGLTGVVMLSPDTADPLEKAYRMVLLYVE